jgi:hypothetical protein
MNARLEMPRNDAYSGFVSQVVVKIEALAENNPGQRFFYSEDRSAAVNSIAAASGRSSLWACAV